MQEHKNEKPVVVFLKSPAFYDYGSRKHEFVDEVAMPMALAMGNGFQYRFARYSYGDWIMSRLSTDMSSTVDAGRLKGDEMVAFVKTVDLVVWVQRARLEGIQPSTAFSDAVDMMEPYDDDIKRFAVGTAEPMQLTKALLANENKLGWPPVAIALSWYETDDYQWSESQTEQFRHQAPSRHDDNLDAYLFLGYAQRSKESSNVTNFNAESGKLLARESKSYKRLVKEHVFKTLSDLTGTNSGAFNVVTDYFSSKYSDNPMMTAFVTSCRYR